MNWDNSFKVDEDHPTECPVVSCRANMREGDDPIAISCIDGYECMDCGCWFDIDALGHVEWIYASAPIPL